MPKSTPNRASKSLLKLNQSIISILFNFKEDLEEETTYIFDQKISNSRRKKVIKWKTKKKPSKVDTRIDIFKFELYLQFYFKKKDINKNVEFKKNK